MQVRRCRCRASSGNELTTNLRQRAKSSDVHLQQRVLAWLLGQRLRVKRDEIFPAAQRIAQIHLMVAEEAGAQAAISGQSHTIARLTVGVRHWSNDADRSRRPVE